MEEETNLNEEESNEENESDEEDVEEITLDNEARIDALTELLIKKGVITEEEFGKAYDEQFEDDKEEEKPSEQPE